MRFAALVFLGAVCAAPAVAQEVGLADLGLHDRLLILDTHLDTPALFEREGWDFSDWHDQRVDNSQVDIPRMQQGGLDGGFFVIYTPQGDLTPQGYAAARDSALGRAAAILRVMTENREKIGLAYEADDVERLQAAGKLVAFQSIENSYPLGTDLSMLESFYKLGVRMAGPVHSKNNQFADSTTDKPRWNGLSPLGRQWVAEMNRLGMIVDGSHSSDATFDQLVALSKTPIILSHSGPRSIFNHPRNLDDDRMRKLARSGGVMQLNSVFLVPHNPTPERSAIEDRQRRWEMLNARERQQLLADKAKLDATAPSLTATFDQFMNSLLHALRVMGVDHVGLGADWDGGGGTIGMEDIAALPKITARLRQEGYSEADLRKIYGGNTLRLLRQAEAYATRNRRGAK
ncbi:dipeptidase [Sphingosinicella rhizophila]|uniref:Dipeptidase n=1 Tax=Sphingosinicella rhizophila TaxID=3050082 RepID=A0ABU3Q1Q6_9SPHN|nr:dipeptidase [Sphingosinicella sp. GR2756]MDT9597350.1 dipeptidase [Sphingosinicella sp. GR2756]